MLSPLQQQALRANKSMGLRSPEFQHGRQIPREYTGFGEDVSPPLEWTGVPTHAEAIALVMDDPDAPDVTAFTHWTVWNLPPRMTTIERAAKVIPTGAVEGRNDFGTTGYRGPKPPSGTHRYHFRVLALDKFLDLPPNAPVEDVWNHLAGHVIGWGELVGTVSRS